MADENLEGQTADGEIDNTTGSAQNTGETQGDVSPASQSETELVALRAQVAREKERNQFLEQSLKIQERFLQSREQHPTTSQATPAGEPVDKDMEVLDKALDPLIQRKLKAANDPILRGYSTVIEDNDALRFEMFLTRNHPDLLEDEDSYNRTVQQVQQVREAANQRGINISRVDAFVFNEGLQGTRQKQAQRKQKKTSAATQESRRQAETRTAEATSTSGAPRAAANAGIQAIRAKAAKGERLTEQERTQYRDWVSNVEI